MSVAGPVCSRLRPRSSASTPSSRSTTTRWRCRQRRLDARDGDLSSDALPPAETIVANLLLEPLLELAERLERAPRALIASGLIDGQGEALSASLAGRLGLRERERRSEGEWLAILYERGSPPPYSLA
jgi:ribosomal protein L11 methylase PrmA